MKGKNIKIIPCEMLYAEYLKKLKPGESVDFACITKHFNNPPMTADDVAEWCGAVRMQTPFDTDLILISYYGGKNDLLLRTGENADEYDEIENLKLLNQYVIGLSGNDYVYVVDDPLSDIIDRWIKEFSCFTYSLDIERFRFGLMNKVKELTDADRAEHLALLQNYNGMVVASELMSCDWDRLADSIGDLLTGLSDFFGMAADFEDIFPKTITGNIFLEFNALLEDPTICKFWDWVSCLECEVRALANASHDLES